MGDLHWLEVPGTAEAETESGIAALEPRRSVCRGPVAELVPVILTPLQDVAAHIVEAPGIGVETADWHGRHAPFALRVATTVAFGVRNTDALDYGQQPIALAGSGSV